MLLLQKKTGYRESGKGVQAIVIGSCWAGEVECNRVWVLRHYPDAQVRKKGTRIQADRTRVLDLE